MNDMIKISKLNKSFDGIKKINVLNNVTFNFRKGKIYSLMGPSGSGKSTLLNLLSLIDRPNSGTILFENKFIDYKQKSKNDILRANKIGIIYQQDNLLPDFTALENIYLASLAAGNNKQISITKAKNLLKKIGLLNRSDHYPSQLSGGEKQRISIVRAVVNDPEIILADEPTGSLDLKTAKDIFKLLENQINQNRLIIFATHNRFFANKADCKLEIVNGNIKTINA
tara:strand:+ start:286 stop:963 length:678 start_codon:yes stop_codon:yes gene_type:complete